VTLCVIGRHERELSRSVEGSAIYCGFK